MEVEGAQGEGLVSGPEAFRRYPEVRVTHSAERGPVPLFAQRSIVKRSIVMRGSSDGAHLLGGRMLPSRCHLRQW
jgi:hypothetical protein